MDDNVKKVDRYLSNLAYLHPDIKERGKLHSVVLASDYDALAARYRMLQRWWLLCEDDAEPAGLTEQDFDWLDEQLAESVAKQDRRGGDGPPDYG